MSILIPDNPARDDVLAGRPTLWLNPDYREGAMVNSVLPLRPERVTEAEKYWAKLAPLLCQCFPELEQTGGRIISPLIRVPDLQKALSFSRPEFGQLFVKNDGALPVAGSIKARGGVYEVFMHAIYLAEQAGIYEDDITTLISSRARELFSEHTVAVGSTGNLGMSVGIAARALGFRAVVHMSADAKSWKVDRLTRQGVEVIQHQADYTTAVEHARIAAEASPSVYFVDDERSELLFLGYSAAARELAEQLALAGRIVDLEHPLFVYLPCGIGGAPGGVAFGLKAIFGDAVHAFFVEPVQSPCAMVHMMSGSEHLVSVYDVGLTNKTEADGMAVARMSAFVASVMRPMLSGIFTVEDDDLFRWLWKAQMTEQIRLEPSAAAGFGGPDFLINTPQGRAYAEQRGIGNSLEKATHVVWTTGGAFVPQEQFWTFMKRGQSLSG